MLGTHKKYEIMVAFSIPRFIFKRYGAFKKTIVRQLTYILVFIVSATFTACGQTKSKSNFEKLIIDIETVDYIEIKNRAGQSDTLDNLTKRLTDEQKNQFIEKYNNSKPNGLRKAIPLYFIDVNLKDGTKRNFSMNGQYIKENNDYCFDLGDSKFIESIWNKLNQSQSNTKFFIKDESKYSLTFLAEFKARHSVYQTASLIDDTIIINNDKVGHVIIPTDLPLNQQVTYEKTKNRLKHILTVKRINYSTLEYNYFEAVNGQQINQKQGTADIEPVFYFGTEGTFEDEDENIYGMNEYIDNSEKDCWLYIYVGVGSIEKSQLIQDCETGRNKINTGLLIRTK
jgi:hypothetical protein